VSSCMSKKGFEMLKVKSMAFDELLVVKGKIET
jgi:hypothetical protein